MNKELFIVVLNWNGWNYTKPCLESIKQEPFDNYTIILVDNGSDKKETEKINEYCNEHYQHKLFFTDKEALSKNTESNFGDFFNIRGKDKIIVIRNSDNLGFAGGNNVALRFIANIGGQYAFLLNNDTIVSDSAICQLLHFPSNIPNTLPSHHKYGSLNHTIVFGIAVKSRYGAQILLCI